MAKQLQLRGGTTAEHSTFIGANKEVTVDTDKQELVLHDGSTVGGIPIPNKDYVNNKPSGFKNYIINGGFDIWQRGTNFNSYGYTADRWRVETGGGGYSVDAGISTGVNNRNSLFVSRGGNSAGNMTILQRLEADNIKAHIGKEFTVSFYAKLEGSENTIDFRVWTPSSLVKDSWGQRTYTDDTVEISESISVTGSFAKYTYTFTIPSNSVYGMAIGFQTLGDTTLVNKMYISQVQLEEGSVATNFEQRPYTLELALVRGHRDEDRVFLIGTSKADSVYEYIDPSGTIVGKNSNGEYVNEICGKSTEIITIAFEDYTPIPNSSFSELGVNHIIAATVTIPSSFVNDEYAESFVYENLKSFSDSFRIAVIRAKSTTTATINISLSSNVVLNGQNLKVTLVGRWKD